jgi:hypothetical protein
MAKFSEKEKRRSAKRKPTDGLSQSAGRHSHEVDDYRATADWVVRPSKLKHQAAAVFTDT